MTTYDAVPELRGEVLLSDTGVETDLIFHQGFDLPLFAAFVLGDDAAGRGALDAWHRAHAQAAIEHGLGVSLDAATWRASSDWGDQLGYDTAALDRVNQGLVAALHALRADLGPGPTSPVTRVGGTLGPRGDGYSPAFLMRAQEAADYHRPQIRSFVGAGADRVTALTLGYVGEAVGIARAAADLGLPVLIGFTVETDGRLPDGTHLRTAVESVDAQTDASAAGFVINCAHPDHIRPAIDSAGREEDDAAWLNRLIGLRPNASRRSHAELDEAPDLDDGDPAELGLQVADLRRALPSVGLVGGCCGTDVRHARAIAGAVAATRGG